MSHPSSGSHVLYNTHVRLLSTLQGASALLHLGAELASAYSRRVRPVTSTAATGANAEQFKIRIARLPWSSINGLQHFPPQTLDAFTCCSGWRSALHALISCYWPHQAVFSREHSGWVNPKLMHLEWYVFPCCRCGGGLVLNCCELLCDAGPRVGDVRHWRRSSGRT